MKSELDYDEPKESKVRYLKFGKKDEATIDVLPAKKNPGTYNSIHDEILRLKPTVPVYCVRPHTLKKTAGWFLDNFKLPRFNSDVLYSVKSNPDHTVLKHLYDAGIRHFDAASVAEIQIIKDLFGESAKIYFMHPVKSREAIHVAYFDYGVRDFALDSSQELQKILEVTDNAKDLGLHLRLAISNAHAAIDLSGKFGILPSESVPLLRRTRAAAQRLGVCFHVGSQCMEPTEYRNALTVTKEVLEQAKVTLDVLDVGGGFPSIYPGLTPPDIQAYFDEIFDAITQMDLDKDCQIWCEPGRALVAEAASLVVRVDARKKNMLYINDGTYGGLFDAGFPGFVFHSSAIRTHGETLSKVDKPFGFYGPTCDSLDTMKGPFYLPENIGEGDYIEISQMGAYSRSLRTEFNGFEENIQIEVCDEPLVSMYNDSPEEEQKRQQ